MTQGARQWARPHERKPWNVFRRTESSRSTKMFIAALLARRKSEEAGHYGNGIDAPPGIGRRRNQRTARHWRRRDVDSRTDVPLWVFTTGGSGHNARSHGPADRTVRCDPIS